MAINRIRKLGEITPETLELIPTAFKGIQHVRETFTCRSCERISEVPAPPHPIARGRAGPGPSQFGVFGLNFYVNSAGNTPVLNVTCSAGCTASGNGVYITGLGSATAGVSYTDISGQTVSAAITFDASAITVSSFSVTGGVYDATGPIIATVSPATGSPAGGTAQL